MNILKQLPPKPYHNQFVAIDTEWFNINSNMLHRPISGQFGCLSVCYEPDTVYLIQDKDDVSKVLDIISDGIWIGHNLKFDLTHLRRLAQIPPRKKIWDTMLIDQELWGGYYDLFGLEDVARRYLSIEMDKSLQKSFEQDIPEMSDQQIIYAATDAAITLNVAKEQCNFMDGTDLRIWREIDAPTMWSIMDFIGFRINVDAWRELAIKNKQRQQEIDEQLPFNPCSSKAVKQYLSSRGFLRLPNTQEKTLIQWSRKYPECDATELTKQVLLSRKYSKRASTYGMNFIEKYLEQEDGVDVIHCEYWINGTETGRLSATNPPMQTIISRDTNEFRNCFIARPGNKIVIWDWVAQEMGVAAYVSNDPVLIKIFNSGKDIYITTALEVFNEVIKNKSDPRRKTMKSLVLGLDYGLSKYGLAEREGMTINDADDLIHRYLRRLPKFASWMVRQQKQKSMVTSVLGRKIHLNPYSGQAKRNALNAPIQSTAGDMMKKALSVMHQEWDFDCPFAMVETTHDECGVDVPEGYAKEVKAFGIRIMEQVAREMCPGIEFRVDAKVCDTWGEKE